MLRKCDLEHPSKQGADDASMGIAGRPVAQATRPRADASRAAMPARSGPWKGRSRRRSRRREGDPLGAAGHRRPVVLRSESDLKKTTNIAPGGGADRHMHANRHFDGYACIRCSSLARTPFWGGQWDPDFARRPAPVGVGRSIEIRCDGLPPRPAKQCRPGLGLGGGG